MTVEQDPYFADGATAGLGSRLGGWVAVYCLNLIMPLMLAWRLTREVGRVGMGLAVLVLLMGGCFVVVRHRWLAMALVIGGLVVAVTQFFPILQVAAGMLGLGAAELIGLSPYKRGLAGELCGFTATLVAGSLLIGVALAIGLVGRSLVREDGKGGLAEPR